MTFLPREFYRKIAGAMPILCVDVILRNRKGEYLLLKRLNEPKKGRWWPVGGRVLRGENLTAAARRKVREEAGFSVKALQPVGYFEYPGGRGPFGITDGFHTVSIVFEGSIGDRQHVVLDEQSAGWKYARQLPKDFRVVLFPGTGSLPVSHGKGTPRGVEA